MVIFLVARQGPESTDLTNLKFAKALYVGKLTGPLARSFGQESFIVVTLFVSISLEGRSWPIDSLHLWPAAFFSITVRVGMALARSCVTMQPRYAQAACFIIDGLLVVSCHSSLAHKIWLARSASIPPRTLDDWNHERLNRVVATGRASVEHVVLCTPRYDTDFPVEPNFWGLRGFSVHSIVNLTAAGAENFVEWTQSELEEWTTHYHAYEADLNDLSARMQEEQTMVRSKYSNVTASPSHL
eukprot:5510971-Amphidinium_carterae.1